MRIVHCCLSCFYIDGYSYQENELIREHVKMGHEVLVLASTESFDENQNKVYVRAKEYLGEEGAKVIRLPFAKWLPHVLMRKVKAYSGVMRNLKEFQPDIIIFHGVGAYEILTVASFKKSNKDVVLYVDNHADKNNSGRGFISLNILHKIFYKFLIKKALPEVKKLLCVSIDAKNYCLDTYSVPEEKLEFYPLGGHVFNDEEYFYRRLDVRRKFNLDENSVLFLQTGKFDKKKKLEESLNSFSQTNNPSFKFFIAGSLHDSVVESILPLIQSDDRISFLGWKDSEFMKSLLCAADVYVQPGSQSATMQMSLCARCPVILDDVESHRVFIDGNGWLVKSNADLADVFLSIEDNQGVLEEMSQRSYMISENMLDYKKLAKRILE